MFPRDTKNLRRDTQRYRDTRSREPAPRLEIRQRPLASAVALAAARASARAVGTIVKGYYKVKDFLLYTSDLAPDSTLDSAPTEPRLTRRASRSKESLGILRKMWLCYCTIHHVHVNQRWCLVPTPLRRSPLLSCLDSFWQACVRVACRVPHALGPTPALRAPHGAPSS